jgi:hypothetical protein
LCEAFDPGGYLALAGLSQIVGGLHAQPKVGLSTQSSFQAKSHVGSDGRLAADDAIELLARDTQARGRTWLVLVVAKNARAELRACSGWALREGRAIHRG